MAKGESRLGKGLGALLGEYLEETEASRPDRELPLDSIRPNPYQPRTDFAEPAIAALADSIRQNGLLQPLVVRRSKDGWELVAGERRWRALRRLGRGTAPVLVRELSDQQMLVLALVENLQREDLTPLEEAIGYQRLTDDFGLTQQEVAERVGKDRSTVANTLRLLALPEEARELLAAGKLSAGHARAILGAPNEAAQVALAREVVSRGLTVRATERRVRELRGGGRKEASGRGAGRGVEVVDDPVARRAERALERALGTQVRLRLRESGAGEIAISFHDPEDFGRLFRLILGEEAAGGLLDP